MAFGFSVLFLPGLNAGRSCARLRDGFSCVANPECGWCAHKFSCVPGNESGPLSSLRCDGNSSDVELHRAKVLDMNYRVPHVEGCTNEDRSKCARYHGPLYTYTADELNATGYRGVNYTYSAPEIWDVLCEAGGMRSSANSTKGSGHTPYWTSQARESATQASTSPPGLIPACDCPDGRAGITCGGCNADAGCGAGEECRRSFSLGRGGNISCEIEEMVPDYMKLMTQWYNASGTRVLFTGEETRASDIACPAQVEGEVSFPWSEGDRCFEWQSSAEPESTTSHYQNNGWARYAECNLIRAQLTPPVHVICRGRSGQPLPPRASSPCVVRLPVRSLSFRLTCQLQGEFAPPASHRRTPSGVPLLADVQAAAAARECPPARTAAAGPAASGSALSWSGVAYDVGRKRILEPNSHRLCPGLSCLIGPSGAGKSSLLGILAGRKSRGRLRGTVALGGVGYVTQDDVLPGTSTVAEHLHFHARASSLIGDAHMRGLSGGERRRVSVAVELIAIHGSPRSVLLTGSPRGVLLMDEPLSGLDSTNARLVVAALCDLVGVALPANDAAAPPPAALAEPAAGGEGGAAGGRVCACPTILLSVHQPTYRFLEAMTGLVAMAAGGRLLYGGPWFDADGASPRLAQISPNPAEALLDALADPSGAMVLKIEALLRAEAGKATPPEEIAEPAAEAGGWRGLLVRAARRECAPVSFAMQLDSLSARHCRLALRHPMLIWVNLVSTLVLAVLAGFAFWQTGKNNALDSGVLQRIGLLFFLMLVFMLTSLINIQLWHSERLLYFQARPAETWPRSGREIDGCYSAHTLPLILFSLESSAGCYGPLGYVASKFLFDALPLRVVPSLLCAAIVYPMAGLHSSAPLGAAHSATGPPAALMFALGLSLANLVGYSLASAIGIACRSPSAGMQLGAMLALYSFLFCGLLVNKATLERMGEHLAQSGSAALGGLVRALPATSFMFRFLEMVLVNELGTIGAPMVDIEQRAIPGSPHYPAVHVPGPYILDFLGYNHGDEGAAGCWLDMPCAAWADLQALVLWLVAGQASCYLLLRFFVSDPH
ncbi:hypothetical protein EMIHUDRAFT_95225 [Emiliania huxleyi CCMP1516]|uniref:ABC transporter domain-containing protein n=3 Tax=Emiliania huxleyi TaxID=2903 RepID=A0A0D3L228_EMIH1|nr:hypothetical protein EMIHUDRAFT_95225 [Emiliania huxleyi CCMP1516]EOD42063.1 hypothetical protein EMIHUDRAFT_95225 [Emiliania huxleyi CCMP1516]|eukprot:XP_005794492.1 hypothetical protein EMIHUDRAFT_95225 [Emiliania huxleyi CCMP1516]